MIVGIVRDLLWFASVAAIATGLWWLHPAAALIGTGGIVLVCLVMPRRG